MYICGKNICTKELNCSPVISVEKDCEVSMIELVDCGYIIVCVYRSTGGNFWTFLKNLEQIVQEISLEIKSLYYVATGTYTLW